MNAQELKRAAAEKAVSYIEDGMVVGLGTGSTARFAIEFIGEMVAAGVRIQGVPSSAATEKLARQHRIPLLFDFDEIDLSIDGADEVDGEGSLIKGGGGALAREKIVLAASKNQIIIVDESKVVAQLGSFPLPVEILPFGWRSTARQLLKLGCGVNLRKTGEKAYLTDNQNFILDCQFEKIAAPALMTTELNSIPGVVENGLFVKMVDLVVVGRRDGTITETTF